jgi:cell shape-determining protein MreD
MNAKKIAAAGITLITLQYLLINELSNAFILPELAVVLLVINYRYLDKEKLLGLAIIFGYYSEVLGALVKGQYLLAYLAVFIFLIATKRLKTNTTLLKNGMMAVLSLAIFHFCVAMVANPVDWTIVLSIIILQGLTIWPMLIINDRAQAFWRPR